jgi:hypothetical protein
MLENNSPTRRTNNAWLPLALMVAALVLRVLRQHHIFEGSGNFSPLMAFAFTGSVVFPRAFPWWSWAVILLGVDFVSEGSAWWSQADGRPEVLLAYGCYGLAAFWGATLRGRGGVVDTLVRSMACSVMFYVVTNTLCWMVKPYYSKDLAGWVQALTIGRPDVHPTTLEFFRNSLAADLLGSVVLLAVYNAEALFRHLRTIPLMARTQATAA